MSSGAHARGPVAGAWDRSIALAGLLLLLPCAWAFMFVPYGLQPGRCQSADGLCDVLIDLGTLLLLLLPWICIAGLIVVMHLRMGVRRPAWWLPVAAVAAYFVVAIPTVVAIERLPRGAADTSAGGDPAEAEPQRRPDEATVFATLEEACDDLTTGVGQAPRTTRRDAAADRTAIGDEFFDQDDRGVTLVGLSRCGPVWVVSVGVSDQSAVLPRFGRNGTPVMAYVQPEIYASVS